MIYLLDTDHLSILQRRRGADYAVLVLLGYELFANAIEDFRRFAIVPFDTAAQAAFDGLKAAKIRVGTMDLRIAAIALSRNLVVVTRNVSDFGQVPGLTTEDWTR